MKMRTLSRISRDARATDVLEEHMRSGEGDGVERWRRGRAVEPGQGALVEVDKQGAGGGSSATPWRRRMCGGTEQRR
jgi:hypothetical protein